MKYVYKVVHNLRQPVYEGLFVSWCPILPGKLLEYKLGQETKALPNSYGIYCFSTLRAAESYDCGVSHKSILRCRPIGVINKKPIYNNGDGFILHPCAGKGGCITVDAVVPVKEVFNSEKQWGREE